MDERVELSHKKTEDVKEMAAHLQYLARHEGSEVGEYWFWLSEGSKYLGSGDCRELFEDLLRAEIRFEYEHAINNVRIIEITYFEEMKEIELEFV